MNFTNCYSCNNTQCLTCFDGYFLDVNVCRSCSIMGEDCLLCDSALNCKLRNVQFQSQDMTILYIVVGIIAFLAFVVLLIVVLYRYCRWRSRSGRKNKEASAIDVETNRRMREEEQFSSEMEITENKLCHFCMERKGTVMKI